MHFKISVGQVALEYDGDEAFFSKDVAAFVEGFLEKVGGVTFASPHSFEGSGANAVSQRNSSGQRHSTNTVAKLLDVKTGPDLILAAVAKKILVDGDATVSRQAIISEMRGATSYYKKTYTSNLSNYLDNLTKADSLRLISEGVYGLPAKMRDSLEPKLNEQ
ncbi:hypothetical protein Q9K01_03590 [Qipengyuania sp. DY56-A-20]|jgi:hypothetical protein|uniref:HTH HARE-type domain-containing protein n=1 Tax=Qipengyuania benthica TaxID=3067651 RepID=A0ABT9H654_9SPHN|nr:hypothetical protein [Qipengyuania sp. DY56-A-20]MDP4538703.1 hypothetical protein [Qipengyuania sp. DY56-A-20]